MNADQRLTAAGLHSPVSVRLARCLSLASRISPSLLRRFRASFLPRSSSGVEAELWFGPLIEIRSARSILVFPDVAAKLRRDLSQSPRQLQAAHQLLVESQRTRPPLVRIEEDLIWLASRRDVSQQDLISRLRAIIKAIHAQDRKGLGRWALGMITRVPEMAELPLVGLLQGVAESRLFDGQITLDQAAGSSLSDGERALLMKDLERVRVGIRWVNGELSVQEPPALDSQLIDVPASKPRLLRATWNEEGATRVATLTWTPGTAAIGRFEAQPPISLATVAGDQYRLLSKSDEIDALRSRVAPYLLTVVDSSGLDRGPAWLVTKRFALAASGSVSFGDAQAVDDANERQTVNLRFPFLSSQPSVLARILDSRPWPQALRAAEDDSMVLLELIDALPEGAGPARVTALDRVGAAVAFGVVDDPPRRVWSRFLIRPYRSAATLSLESMSRSQLADLAAWHGSPLIYPPTAEVLGLTFGYPGRAGLVPWKSVSRAFSALSASIVIAYSHVDERWRFRFGNRLKRLERSGQVEVLDDRPRGDWLAEIGDALERARVAVLLISADFLASPFIRTAGIAQLFESHQAEGLHLLALIVGPCAWQEVGWLARLQHWPQGRGALASLSADSADEELRDLQEVIRSLVSSAPTSGPALVDVERLPVPGPHLVGRDAELAQLDAAWAQADTHVIVLVGFGGVGKSALVSRWLDNMAADGWRGAERVLAWSFFSQGTEGRTASAEAFIDYALRLLGDADPVAGSPHDRGVRLAWLVRQERTLLILDGIELLQYGSGPLWGRLKDPGMAALLTSLASANPGLCLVTSREPVADLAPFPRITKRLDLQQLSPEAAMELLRLLGVIGKEAELRDAAEQVGRHALTLTLLGSYLRRAHGGDVRKRREIDLRRADESQGGTSFRIIAAYVRWLGEGPELAVLRLLSLFAGPADAASLAALRAAPAISGLTDPLVGLADDGWKAAVAGLREHGLLAAADPGEPGRLDAHPLVRAYFAADLESRRPEAWRAGNLRLFEHLQQMAPEFPDTLDAMMPLYAAIVSGCRAGRQEQAADVLWRRVRRGPEDFSLRRLGAFGSELTALASFFDRLWSTPVGSLPASAQAYILSSASVCLRALGRLEEATQPMRASLESYISHADWRNAAVSASNLSQLTLTSGEVEGAVALGTSSVELATRSAEALTQVIARATLGDAFLQAGRWQESSAAFQEAEAMQAQGRPELPFLYSLQGYSYCTLLLDQAEPEDGAGLVGLSSRMEGVGRARQACEEVVMRAKQMLRIASENSWPLDIALAHLSLGRAHLALALLTSRSAAHDENPDAEFARAAEHLERSVAGLRASGQEDYLPSGLLARSALHRCQLDFIHAGADLAEAFEVAERGGMRLHECDAHLEWARLDLHQGAVETTREHLAIARKLLNETGYGRREREAGYLERRLASLTLPLGGASTRDFFLSYHRSDLAWAEWLASVIEEAGYSVILEAWDFRVGANFILEMQAAAARTRSTIVVVSEAYLRAEYNQPEWTAALLQDPRGERRKLIPIRVAPCIPTGVLNNLVYADLVGLTADEAKTTVLTAIATESRAKPFAARSFPGTDTVARTTQVAFPESSILSAAAPLASGSRALAVWREKLDFLLEHEANAADPAQMFALRSQILNARRKIRELGGETEPAAPIPG